MPGDVVMTLKQKKHDVFTRSGANGNDLQRSAKYGSKHYDERALSIRAVRFSADGRTITLEIPDLAPTQCYELNTKLTSPSGTAVERSIHGTIHQLSAK